MNIPKNHLKRLAIILLVTNFILPFSIFGQKRFYISPDDHTDYIWIADDATYRQVFLNIIDYYLNKMDATADQSIRSADALECDGNLWMWEYEKNRTPQQFQRFINRIQDGHMSVALNPLVLVYGGMPAEAVLRGMYYPGLSNAVTTCVFRWRLRWKIKLIHTV